MYYNEKIFSHIFNFFNNESVEASIKENIIENLKKPIIYLLVSNRTSMKKERKAHVQSNILKKCFANIIQKTIKY